MYRAQMTDTELEAYYMEGEFKPTTPKTPIAPKHYTDTELEVYYSSFEDKTTPEANQALVEIIKRQQFINNRGK